MIIRVKGDTVHIEGYVNAVERLSKTLSDRFGDFMERIKAGAFGRALKRNPNVRILLNHNWDRDLGGTDSNLKLEEDNIGLRAVVDITDSAVAEDARKGNLVGWSFGFMDRKGGVFRTEEEGLPVRNVTDLDLYEVSLLNREAIPAYDGTLVSVRSVDGNDEQIKVSDRVDIRTAAHHIEDDEDRAEPEEVQLEEEQKEEPKLEERAEEEKTDNEHADEDNGAVDYTKYKKIIEEMKGDN